MTLGSEGEGSLAAPCLLPGLDSGTGAPELSPEALPGSVVAPPPAFTASAQFPPTMCTKEYFWIDLSLHEEWKE